MEQLVIPVIYLKSPLALDERALYVTILLKIDILINEDLMRRHRQFADSFKVLRLGGVLASLRRLLVSFTADFAVKIV